MIYNTPGYLTIEQRLQRLQVRLDELSCWRDAETLPIGEGWELDGVPVRPGDAWPDRHGVHTFTNPRLAVPPAWPLDQARLALHLGGEGLVRLRFENGEEEGFGHDPNHRRHPLLGRTAALSADVTARLPFGQPVRHPAFQYAALVLEELVLPRYLTLLEAIADACTELDAEVADPLLGAAEGSLTHLDWPSETFPYLQRIKNTRQLQAVWELPAELASEPPAAPLTGAQRESVEDALAVLERDLAALRERYPKRGALLLTGHAHLDLAWLWPLAETRRKARRTGSSMLGLLRRNPQFHFDQSSAQWYDFVEHDDLDLWQQVRDQVATGRWEPVGGMWLEPDCQIPNGESLSRQMLYGQRYFERQFGHRQTVAWVPDCFGFTGALPQLLRLGGLDSFFTIKVNWSETNKFPYDLFWWEGIDGSRVLVHTLDNPNNGYNGQATPASMIATWRNYRGKQLHPESMMPLGFGDGGGGTTQEMIDLVEASDLLPVVPATRWGRVDELFARFHASAADHRLPVWLGNLYLELHRGTLTTQGRTKRLHRQSERQLVAAEVTRSLVALAGGELPGSLEPLWHTHLLNEFHDILPGSSIEEVYGDAEEQLGDVLGAARGAQRDAVAGLVEVSGGRADGDDALLLVNTELRDRPLRAVLDRPLLGAQPTDAGYVLATDDPVPALGTRVAAEASPVAGLEVEDRRLENRRLRVELADDGTLTSIFDKTAGREVLAGPGNQLWVYVDKPRAWDAWDVDAGFRDQAEAVTALESMQVTERGPHRAAIRVVRRFRHSTITQDYRLWSNGDRLDIATTLDWHDRRFLLKARFPLAVRAPYASFETAFGVEQRPTHQNTSWDAAKFEVAGHRFADLSEPGYGVAILNDGKYGHDVVGSEIGLSLVRSPVYPDTIADEGEQSFVYAVCPHPGTWLEGGVLREAEDLNTPLLTRVCGASESRTWRPLALEGLPVALGTLKPLEDGGGLVLRCYEPQGARGSVHATLPEGWALDGELTILEDRTGEAETAFSPFQIRTWSLVKQ
jgi:alpha-mannosidase